MNIFATIKTTIILIELKMRKLIIALIIFLNVDGVFAQLDSVRISEYLKVSRTDETKWIERYQKDIDQYIDQNRSLTDKVCDVLIFGSSSINMWNTIYKDLAPLKVIRRSYGGATIRDMIYNYDVIARGYQPKTIVFYVENDLGSDNDITVGKAYDLFRVMINKLKRDYPNTPLYVMSLKPSPLREAFLEKQQMLNFLLKEYTKEVDNLYFVDVAKAMFDTNNKIREDIFLQDRLHMNAKGYEIWTSILKPILSKP